MSFLLLLPASPLASSRIGSGKGLHQSVPCLHIVQWDSSLCCFSSSARLAFMQQQTLSKPTCTLLTAQSGRPTGPMSPQVKHWSLTSSCEMHRPTRRWATAWDIAYCCELPDPTSASTLYNSLPGQYRWTTLTRTQSTVHAHQKTDCCRERYPRSRAISVHVPAVSLSSPQNCRVASAC